MLLFRWLVLLLLLGALVSFGFYVGTGDPRFKRYGWMSLKWALFVMSLISWMMLRFEFGTI